MKILSNYKLRPYNKIKNKKEEASKNITKLTQNLTVTKKSSEDLRSGV